MVVPKAKGKTPVPFWSATDNTKKKLRRDTTKAINALTHALRHKTTPNLWNNTCSRLIDEGIDVPGEYSVPRIEKTMTALLER